MSPLHSIQRLIESLNQAPTAALAAQNVIDWLSTHVGIAVIALVHPNRPTPEIIINERYAPDAMILAWLRADTDWYQLTEAGETQNRRALIVPLHYGGQMYGVLWQHIPDEETRQQYTQTVMMLAGMLITRIHHFRQQEGSSSSIDSQIVTSLAQQTNRLNAATSVSRVIITSKEPYEMLYGVTELLCHRFGYHSVQVWLYNSDHTALQLEMFYTERGPVKNPKIPLELQLNESSMITWAIQHSEQVIANQARKHPLYRADLHAETVQSVMALPLLSGSLTLGGLMIASTQPHGFSDSDTEIMQSIADQLAVGLANARLFDEVRARAQDLAALTEISLLVNATLDLDQLAQRVYEAFRRLQRVDRFQFVVYDRFTNLLQIETYTEGGNYTSEQREYVPNDDLISQIIDQSTPVFWRNPTERESLAPYFLVEGIRAQSFMGVPMIAKDNIVGALCSETDDANTFDENALQVMLTFANSVAVAIENAELFSYTARRVQELAILNEISHILARNFGAQEFWRQIHRQIVSLFGGKPLYIGLYDEATHLLHYPLVSDETQNWVDLPPVKPIGLTRYLMESGQVLNITDTSVFINTRPHPTEPGHSARSWLGVPLRDSANQVIGLIVTYSLQPTFYSDEDVSLLMTVAAQMSLALENTKLHVHQQKNLYDLQVRAQRLETLHSISTIVSSALDRATVLRATAEQLQHLLDVERCIIVLKPRHTERVLIISYPLELAQTATPIPIGEGGLESILLFKGGIQTLTVATADSPFTAMMKQTQLQQAAIAPLVANDQILGMIFLDTSNRATPPDAEAEQTYAAIARQVSIAIYNADLYEEALIANRLKSQFLANVSHELRTPLNAIIGYSDMLLEGLYGTLTVKQQDRLTRVNRSGAHLLELISDVLDLSKIEAGQFTLELAPLDMDMLIQDTVLNVTPQAEKKGLSVAVSISPHLPQVTADQARIRQVVTNLLSNAVKFTSDGKIALQVAPAQVIDGVMLGHVTAPPPKMSFKDGSWLTISVSDTGIGIKPEDQGLIFDAFRQVDGSSSRQYEGTGLGLAIARQIVQLHGGELWVNSDLGMGSTFTLILPGKLTARRSELLESEVGGQDQFLVLVIDDDPASLQLAQDYLGDHYRVMCTNDPLRGLSLAESYQPVLIVLDIMMPQLNGLDVLIRLKENRLTSNIPVLMLSVLADEKGQATLRQASHYLTKPVQKEHLLEVVQGILAKSAVV
jgi:signal transduction histidine kinase/CheY-like chemotaxis protein/putative methionine-R-sulfoxide reductase with GAF domain